MVETNENSRINTINEAINYGLINRNIVEMVDKFTEKNNLNKSIFVDGIIDPGIKSIDSVLSKLYRKTHIELDQNYSLTDIKDVIRCCIIVDNYNQAIPLIRELRKSIPSLKGDVCENDMGYVGIHLSLTIDGFNAEIQISTREAWYAKQAGEEIYERWRNFSLSKEISYINSISNEEEKRKKINQLFSQYNLKLIQKSYCKNLFLSVNKHTKLDKLKESINAVLYLNSYNYSDEENDNLKIYNIKIQDIKNTDELLYNCQNYLSIAENAKNDLLEYASKALKIIKHNKNNINYTLSEKEKVFITLKRKYFSLIVIQMKKRFNGNFEVSKYISKLNKISNELALNNINYLDIDLIDNLTINYDNEDIIKLEEIVRKDIFSKNYFLSLINTDNNKG